LSSNTSFVVLLTPSGEDYDSIDLWKAAGQARKIYLSIFSTATSDINMSLFEALFEKRYLGYYCCLLLHI